MFINVVEASIATLIFAVHPLHVENVSSIVGRADCLSGIFYLWTLTLCTSSIRSGHHLAAWIYYIISWLYAVAATLSKENGVTGLSASSIFRFLLAYLFFPHTVFLTLLALEVLEDHSSHLLSAPSSPKKSSFSIVVNLVKSGQRVVSTLPSAVRSFASILSLLMFFQFRSWLHGEQYMYSWSLMENQISLLPDFMSRVPAYAQAHFFYVLKLFYPRHLCFDYGFDCIPTVQVFWDSRNLLPLAAYVVVIYSLWVSIRNCERNPIIMFGLAIYIAGLSPALHIFLPVGAIFAERLLFIPSMGFSMSIAAVITQWTWVHAVDDWVERISAKLTNDEDTSSTSGVSTKKRNGSNNLAKQTANKNQSNKFSPFLMLLLIPVLCAFATWSSKRCQAWRSELALFGAALEVCPRSLKSLTNNAMLLSSQPQTRGLSLDYSNRALNFHWNNSMAFLNSAVARQRSGDFLHAIEDLQRALVTHKSVQSKIRGYLAAAMVDWAQALPIQKFEFEGYEDSTHAAEVRTGLMSAAIYWANESLAISQFHPPVVLFYAGIAASELKMHNEAIWLFDKGIEGMERLSKIRESSGNTVFIEDEVDMISLLNQRALALQAAGLKSDSLHSLRQAYDLRPKFVPVMTNYASALRDAGQSDEAKRILKKYIAESFEDEVEDGFIPAIVWNNLGYIEHTIGNFHTALTCYEQAILSFERDPTGKVHGFDQPPSLGEVLAVNLRTVKEITG